MEKYLKAVREMYAQFKQREARPLEKYIGRLVMCYGKKAEVVGYHTDMDNTVELIAEATKWEGWTYVEPQDVIFKKCEAYCYASVNDLID